MYRILVNTPSIFVHRESGFIQIVLNFFLILIGVHRVQGCEKYGLPVPFETFSIHSGWRSASRERYRCGWCDRRSHLGTVHCLAMQDEREYLLNVARLLGNTRNVWKKGFKQYWNVFFGPPPPFAKNLISASTDQHELPENLDWNNSAKSSNLTAPSSSRWTVSSCRNNLIMKFGHFKTNLTEFCWFNVYPFSFTIKDTHKRQR